MNASARAIANRRNAKKSTGPRTGAGKSRVATNAHRHGLAVLIAALPELETRVTALARRIAGENPSTNHADLARRVAEAQVTSSGCGLPSSCSRTDRSRSRLGQRSRAPWPSSG